MNRSIFSKKATFVSIVTLLAVVGIIAYAIVSRLESTEETTVTQPQYTSMEDGEIITELDVEARQEVEDLARQSAIDYFKKEYLTQSSIIITSIEWYFTDENDSDNILVGATVTNDIGINVGSMKVIEIKTNESGELKVNSIYDPDERYTIYE